MTIRRLRRHGADRWGPFPRSILVPSTEFRRRVSNWADFIELLPAPDWKIIGGPYIPTLNEDLEVVEWTPEEEDYNDMWPVTDPTPRTVERRTYSSQSGSGLGLPDALHGNPES